ncbi:lipid A core-O-antigen ligase-like enyme [Terriglobus roseus DSM 18391]|uniref:Lipid A core-O-antigen ligase-like enyme n=1 Tax=Terriglobus roseus (strain DSM 18391 / NRRL B-41598 / KBS 63) TaxID=926566 RepID=I3ZE88_TERRK|nr:O-antigen ligase family protein [Terriglobus roseus]AFL87556.1 lipid A core-O-antigen ligase-like enyme [Terriglobus roseus DSM 18391]
MQVMMDPAGASSLKALALYTVVVAGAVGTLALRSELGIYLLTVLLPLQTTRYHLHGLPLGSNIVDILLICTLIGTLIRPPNSESKRPAILTFLALLCGFYLLSLWRGAFYLGGQMPISFADPRLVDYKNFIVMPLLAFVALRAIRTKAQIAVVIALCCITAVAVDYSYLKSASGRDFSHYAEETRDAGPLGYAGENGLASYMAEITAFILPILALRKKAGVRLLIVVCVAANIVCVLFSYSREAYLALALTLCFIAVVRVRWLFVPLLCLAIGSQMILPQAVLERIAMTYTRPNAGEAAALDASAQERVLLWTDAINLFQSNPVIGTGFLTYSRLGRVGSYQDTHNFYLKMLVETGVVGLALFLLQLLLLFRQGLRLFVSATDRFLSLVGLGYAALILAAAIVNVFGDRWMFIQVDSNLWILLGCVLSASSLSSDTPTAPVNHKAEPRLRHAWHGSPTPTLALEGATQ